MYKRKRLSAKKPLAKSVKAVVHKAVVAEIKKDAEVKHSFNALNTTASTTIQFNQITSSIVVGTSDTSNRIGDRYRLQGMHIGFNVAAADATNLIRCTLIQWNKNTTPTAAEIFEDSATIPALIGAFRSDSLASKMFTVIKDWHWVLNTASVPNLAIVNKYISLKHIRGVQLFAGSATDGIGTLYLVYQSDSSAVAHPAFQCAWDLHYLDM